MKDDRQESLAGPPPGEHPAIERLVAYEAGELAPREVEELQDHLALCPECARELLDLQLFLAPRAEERAMGEGAAARASWETLRARLAARGGAGETLRPPAPVAPFAPRRSELRARPAFRALAATLAAVALGLPIWLRTADPPVRERTLAVFPLGEGETRRSAETEEPLTLVRSDPMPVVAVRVPAGRAFPAYRVELVSALGEQRQTLASALVAVPLASGGEARYLLTEVAARRMFYRVYRLRLLGRLGGRDELLAEHPVRFVTP